MSNPSRADAAAHPQTMTQPTPPPTSAEPPSGTSDAPQDATGTAGAVEGATGVESGGRARQAATVARAKIAARSAGLSTAVMATLIVAFLGVGVTMLVQTLNTNSNRISDINGSVISLQSSVDSRFAETNRGIDRLRDRMFAEFDKMDASVDARFDEVDAEFDKVDAEFDRVYARFDSVGASMDARFDEVDAEFDRVYARFDSVDARFDRLEVMLAALIASLGQSDAVDTALEGLLNP